MSNSRDTAYKILLKMQKESSYSNILLDTALKESSLSKEDKAFVTALVYGVTERMITLDYILSCYLTKPLKKLDISVLTALRLGTYQIVFMDKVPSYAAINESLKLLSSQKLSYAKGLANAVLRKVAGNTPDYPDDCIRYSVPYELYNLFCNAYGKDRALDILKASVTVPSLYIRVNTLKISEQMLIEELAKENCVSETTELSGCIKITELPVPVDFLSCYKKGFFHVEDISCQRAVKSFEAKKGESILDVCSAPGGKAFTIAEMMENDGNITACDIYDSRIKMIENGASRLNTDIIKTVKNDASILNNDLGEFDRVLCDVPCSGFGIISRKPEIRYKKISEIEELIPIQKKILSVSSEYVKHGGILMYSTCTLNPSENDDVCKEFLTEHKYFKILDSETIFPVENENDGFFYCIMKRDE